MSLNKEQIELAPKEEQELNSEIFVILRNNSQELGQSLFDANVELRNKLDMLLGFESAPPSDDTQPACDGLIYTTDENLRIIYRQLDELWSLIRRI